ncbi:MAG: hypothetical protein GXO10_03290 [Crenarchaeota archaeon]|nr:hypothetical protein [Thermoproteota archaeon]
MSCDVSKRELELWLLARLVDVCTQASGGRPPAYVIFDKVIYCLKMFLEDEKVEYNPFREYRFIPAKRGPYLVKPPLYSIVGMLEIEGLVKTVLEVRPFKEEIEHEEEIEPDKYAELIKQYARNVELYKEPIAYFIVPISENIRKLEEYIKKNINDSILRPYYRGLHFVYSHIRAIYNRYGHVETKFVVEWLYNISKRWLYNMEIEVRSS